jgi:uncharacterized protein (DUF488 family)
MADDSLTPIFTIGYGDRNIESFTAVLQQYQIAYLIDVRTAPYSKFKPDFSKERLERALAHVGIRYLFLGDQLGGRPSDPDCYTNDKVDYEKIKSKAWYQEGIGRLQNAFQQQRRVALMCSEGKPENCHRSKLLGATLTDLNIPVAHIDENDQLKTQAEVISQLTGGQLGLFGDPTFTSRKRYSREEEDHE